MRPPVSRIVLVFGVLAAGSALAATTAKPAHDAPSLTLYEKPDFSGRHVTFHSPSEAALKTFPAHSAKSVGTWTLCDGKDPASKCQTVTSEAATLKLLPAIVRPGVDAVALYDEPELKGKRVIYSFASDKPPPFKAKSARTWGGAWSLCDAATGKCQVIDGERPAAVDVEVGVVRPGRSPGRVEIAAAAPLLTVEEAPQPDTSEDVPEPDASAPPEPPPDMPPAPAAEIAAAAPAPADTPPPAAVAEAAPPLPAAEPPASPYVDIPLPPRPPEAAPQPRAAPPPVEMTIPPPPDVGAVRRVAYVCADGQGLTVLFDDRDATAMVLARGQDPIALRRSRNESEGGFFYEGSGHVLFGAGARAGFASDGARPVDCYAARRQLSYRDGPRYGGGYEGYSQAPPAYYPPR
jgi:hypothetical protein